MFSGTTKPSESTASRKRMNEGMEKNHKTEEPTFRWKNYYSKPKTIAVGFDYYYYKPNRSTFGMNYYYHKPK